MTKKHFLFLLTIIVAGVAFFMVKSKSEEKNRLILKEVMDLHQGADAKIEKIGEEKNSLKSQIELVKVEVATLKEVAKKVKSSVNKAAAQKEEAERAEKIEKAERLSAKVVEGEALIQELEELETELHSWKEGVAGVLKGNKNKISKEAHDKLAVAKAKFAQLHDRLGKSMENAGKAMQHSQEQEKK